MVHHATSARNEVGQAFLPVLPHATLQLFEQQSEDFPYLIFHFSFVTELTSPITRQPTKLPQYRQQQVSNPLRLVSNEK
jgi:hypothetical protein